MNRVVWCVLLGAMGCFDPSHPGADDPASDATPGTDGVTPPADGRTRDAGVAGDAPPLADGCTEGTLCELRAGFEAPAPGWTERMNGGCTVTVSGGTLRIASNGDCTAGTTCELRSPVRRMGTGRIITRTIELSPETNGDLWFEVVDSSDDGPRLYYRPGVAHAVIADGGSESDAGEVGRGDTATWSIRLDDSGYAHFENWNGAAWVEFGSADAPWSAGEDVTMALGLSCSGVTSDTIVGEWGPVGGVP